MSPRATLTRTPRPDLGAEATQYTVDCRHATTEAVLLPGSGNPTPTQWALALLLQHELAERCGCVADVYARYAAPVSASTGRRIPSLRALDR